MPPSPHNTTTTAWATVSSQGVARPTRSDGTAAQVGDTVWLVVHYSGASGFATPAVDGFVFVGRRGSIRPGTTAEDGVIVYRRYVQPTEPTSYALSYGATLSVMVSATLVLGARASDPVAGTSAASSDAANTSVVMASVDPDSSDVLILAAHIAVAGNLASTSTFAPAAGWTERYDLNSGALTAVKRVGALTYATQANDLPSASPSHATSESHANDATFAVAIASPSDGLVETAGMLPL